jgi:hypothetical protein
MTRGAPYDPRAVVVSLEFPPFGQTTCFKVDVNCVRFFASDEAADRSVTSLLKALRLDDGEYRALREVCAPRLSSRSVERYAWLGTAVREDEQRANVYLHPGRP